MSKVYSSEVANTGISAMVDPLGRSKSRILLGEQGYRDVGVPDPIKLTIYSTIGARTWNSASLTAVDYLQFPNYHKTK